MTCHSPGQHHRSASNQTQGHMTPMTTTIVSLAKSSAAGILEATVQDVASVRTHTRLVDVREPDEFVGELGHIPGAELVPLATVEAAAAAWDKNQEIVLVCRSGGRSGRATASLKNLGFTKVVNMTGGMLAYNEAKLPTEK